MKDVLDLNPDMTVADIREWADETDNPAFADYLNNVADEHEADT